MVTALPDKHFLNCTLPWVAYPIEQTQKWNLHADLFWRLFLGTIPIEEREKSDWAEEELNCAVIAAEASTPGLR